MDFLNWSEGYYKREPSPGEIEFIKSEQHRRGQETAKQQDILRFSEGIEGRDFRMAPGADLISLGYQQVLCGMENNYQIDPELSYKYFIRNVFPFESTRSSDHVIAILMNSGKNILRIGIEWTRQNADAWGIE